jgi:hypothetical protein
MPKVALQKNFDTCKPAILFIFHHTACQHSGCYSNPTHTGQLYGSLFTTLHANILAPKEFSQTHRHTYKHTQIHRHTNIHTHTGNYIVHFTPHNMPELVVQERSHTQSNYVVHFQQVDLPAFVLQ